MRMKFTGMQSSRYTLNLFFILQHRNICHFKINKYHFKDKKTEGQIGEWTQSKPGVKKEKKPRFMFMFS